MTSDSARLVAFENVALGYGRRPILADLSFCICRGDFLGIVGPNGAGKTTILRGVLGLLPPVRGTITLHGRHDDGFHFGYVPQRETVDEGFPLTVLDVVLMGRYKRAGRLRRPGARDREAAKRALAAVGITPLADSPYRTLSGGQKQRALIARALASEPDLLVLDEPTSGMDLRGETAVMGLIHRLHRERGITVVMVSHQLNTVAKWVDRIGILHHGRLELGPPSEILTAETLSRVYGEGADVVEVRGERVVLPPRETP